MRGKLGAILCRRRQLWSVHSVREQTVRQAQERSAASHHRRQLVLDYNDSNLNDAMNILTRAVVQVAAPLGATTPSTTTFPSPSEFIVNQIAKRTFFPFAVILPHRNPRRRFRGLVRYQRC